MREKIQDLEKQLESMHAAMQLLSTSAMKSEDAAPRRAAG